MSHEKYDIGNRLRDGIRERDARDRQPTAEEIEKSICEFAKKVRWAAQEAAAVFLSSSGFVIPEDFRRQVTDSHHRPRWIEGPSGTEPLNVLSTWPLDDTLTDYNLDLRLTWISNRVAKRTYTQHIIGYETVLEGEDTGGYRGTATRKTVPVYGPDVLTNPGLMNWSGLCVRPTGQIHTYSYDIKMTEEWWSPYAGPNPVNFSSEPIDDLTISEQGLSIDKWLNLLIDARKGI